MKSILDESFSSIRDSLIEAKLLGAQTKEFKDWMKSKGVHYHGTQVAWNDESYNLYFRAQRGFCHANSLRLHVDHNIETSSGFVIQSYLSTKNFNLYVIHSFNLVNHRVIDYTYYQDKEDLMGRGLKLPCEYFGVTIPDIFIKELISQIINPRFGSISNPKIGYFFPLIVSYFYFDKGDSYWRKCFE